MYVTNPNFYCLASISRPDIPPPSIPRTINGANGAHSSNARNHAQNESTTYGFVTGQNRLFQSYKTASPETQHEVIELVSSDVEDLQQEYERIASYKVPDNIPDNKNSLQGYRGFARLADTGSTTKHTIIDDGDSGEFDEDYDPEHEEIESECSESDEEDKEKYLKEAIIDVKHLNSECQRDFFPVRCVKGFFKILLFLPQYLLSLLPHGGSIIRAAISGLLLIAFAYIMVPYWPQLYLNTGLKHGAPAVSDGAYEISDLVQRLAQVEFELSLRAKQSAAPLGASEAILNIESQIKNILDSISSLRDSSNAASSWAAGLEEKVADTSESLMSERKDRITAIQNLANSVPIEKINESIEQASKQIGSLESRVKDLEEAKLVEQSVVEILDKYLPSRLVVQFDTETGSITAVPEFWKYMSAQLSQVIPENEQQSQSKEGFMLQNQKFIEEYMKEYLNNVQPKKLENLAVVSKDVFKEMMRVQLESLRKETMKQLDTLDKRIHNDMNAFVHQSQLAEALPETVIFENGTATATEAALSYLVKQSLQRYISHTISKPDFADPATGAKVIPQLTSGSYDWRDGLAFRDRVSHKLLGSLGFGRMKVNRPVTAFSSDMKLGACWPFNGAKGQIGIDLGRKVSLSDVGVVHVRADQSPNPKSAPRVLSVYAYVGDAELRSKIRKLVGEQDEKKLSKIDVQIGTESESEVETATEPGLELGLESARLQSKPQSDPEKTDLELESQIHADPSLTQSYAKIMTLEYDVFNGDEFQVFPIPEYIKRLGLATSRVVFKFESNWGHVDFTCIYRLRLFGELYEERVRQVDVEAEVDLDVVDESS